MALSSLDHPVLNEIGQIAYSRVAASYHFQILGCRLSSVGSRFFGFDHLGSSLPRVYLVPLAILLSQVLVQLIGYDPSLAAPDAPLQCANHSGAPMST